MAMGRRTPLASGFNSRAREGATSSANSSGQLRVVSIHAPVRARPAGGTLVKSHLRFNSRAREGATHYRRLVLPSERVSIHAPVRARLLDYIARTDKV